MGEISEKLENKIDIKKIKEEIKILIDKHENFSKSDKLKSLKEESTKQFFVLPLFKALGWDVYNDKGFDLSPEEQISKGFVDYGFRIGEIPQFFLEAKSIKVGVDDDKSAIQAIQYAYNKGCTWAILTDFETVRVYNAQWKEKEPILAQFFKLQYNEFLEDERLLLLSRPAMALNLLDEAAEKWGKKIKKSPIDKQLLSDLTEFREILSKSISHRNKENNISDEDLDESVQKILDRLIFIRTVEDREIEPPLLRPLIRENHEGKLWSKICQQFRIFDNIYDSELFAPHVCETLKIDDLTLEKIIRGLHETIDRTVQYNFSAIDADVLGSMYEQYLGHILKKTQKTAKLKNGAGKRKEQGIYYTPTYVVDYIINNTVGKKIKDDKGVYKKIRIIDPACGSGSFLLRAFDYLIRLDRDLEKREKIKQQVYGKGGLSTERFLHMKNSLYGVDLDQKAVEITQLNLLLRATEKKEKLPTLRENVRLGNSLLSKEKFSDKFIDWKTKFPDVFPNIGLGEDGFDILIGNPPYFNLQTLHDSNYKDGLKEEYADIYSGQNDILYFFYFLGTKIVKENGYIGLITSRYFLEADFAVKLRRFLKENSELIQIIDFGSKVRIFQDASINTCILIFKNKQNKKQENKIQIVKVKDWKETNLSLFEFIKNNITNNVKNSTIEIFQKPQKDLSDLRWSLRTEEESTIVEKLGKNSKPLGDFEGEQGVCTVFKSIESGLDRIKINDNLVDVFRVSKNTIERKNLEKEILQPLIKNGMIRRYQINYNDEFLICTLNDTMIENFPNVKKHLEEFQTELKNRYDFKKGNFDWWRLSNLRNINLIFSEKDKLFVPMIAPENRFVFIKSNSFICCADVYVVILKDDNFNLRYIQGVLNSKLMNFLVKKNAKAVDGSAKTSTGEAKRRYSYSVGNISNLPIKITNENTQNEIAKLVEEIELLYEELRPIENKETEKKHRLIEKIKIINSQIDEKVFEIYGITEDEMTNQFT